MLRRIAEAFMARLAFFLAAPAVVFLGYALAVGLVAIAKGP